MINIDLKGNKTLHNKQQIKLEFSCLILLDDRTNCVNLNDRNTSPNWTLSFAFAEILLRFRSFLSCCSLTRLLVPDIYISVYHLPVLKYHFLQGHLDHLR
jgi:hypothetical protein